MTGKEEPASGYPNGFSGCWIESATDAGLSGYDAGFRIKSLRAFLIAAEPQMLQGGIKGGTAKI